MKERLLGYCRVSSLEQNESRQVIAMREFGVAEADILVEKLSGKDFNRPVYQGMIKSMKPGDVLVIKSLDRLGRSYDAVIEEYKHITKDLGLGLVILDMPLLNSTERGNGLMSDFISDLVLNILSFSSNLERNFIHQRQQEGIAAAKARGVQFGTPPKERPVLFEELQQKYECGEITSREAGELLGVSHSTFQRWVKGE